MKKLNIVTAKLCLVVSFTLSSSLFTLVYAQVAINPSGTSPAASAILDLNAGNAGVNKGFLAPQVALTNVATAAPVTSPATGLIVYSSTAPTNGNGKGYYFWTGTAWESLNSTVEGSGTTNYLARWTPNGTTLGKSLVEDNGTRLSIDTVPVTANVLYVNSNTENAIAGRSSFGGSDGVYGQNDNNVGVLGSSANGSGTAGVSTNNTGVYGASTSGEGVYGISSNSIGVYGEGDTYYGVYGISNNGIGVYGYSNLDAGMFGFSPTSYGVYGTSNHSRGVYGECDSAYGVYGLAITNRGVGTFGEDDNNVGVYGLSVNFAGILGVGGLLGGEFQDASDSYIATLGDANNFASGSFLDPFGDTTYINQFGWGILSNGVKSTMVRDEDNKNRVLFCNESPEVMFEDYGEGQLVNGKAHINLDPIFAKNVCINKEHPLRVFIQLEENETCKGVITKNKSANGFDVVELSGGNSNTPFEWHIVCNRANEKGQYRNYADKRFPVGPVYKASKINIPKQESSNNVKPRLPKVPVKPFLPGQPQTPVKNK